MKLKMPHQRAKADFAALADAYGQTYTEENQKKKLAEGNIEKVKKKIFDLAEVEGETEGKQTTFKGERYEVGFSTPESVGLDHDLLKQELGADAKDYYRMEEVFDTAKFEKAVADGSVKVSSAVFVKTAGSRRVLVKSIKKP